VSDAGRITHLEEMHRDAPVKVCVRAATTVAGTLASSFENGDTIDGITLATGDRILIKNQAAGAANGIYVVAASGAPARAFDMDTASEVRGSLVYVLQGTTNGGTLWANTNTGAVTLGSTALTFAQIGGSSASFATPAIVLGSAAAAGAASTVIRSDATIAAFDATAPVTQAFGDAAAVGTAAFAARRDHKHGMPSSPGGSGTLTTIEEADGSPTDSAVTKLVLPNGTLSIVGHVATYTPAASGGSLSMPTVVQGVASSGVNTTNPTLTIAAAASGNRIVLGLNLVGRASTSVTCTNVTWTKIVGTATSGGGSRYELWVGVVAGGSSGTTITVNTASSNFASLVAMEITDALTPTLTSSYSAAFPSTTQLLGPLTATAGHLLIWFVGADNTTNAIQIFPWSPAQPFWRAATGTGATLAVGYAPSGPTGASALNASGAGWAMIAEVT
jgi:hypothetical protein